MLIQTDRTASLPRPVLYGAVSSTGLLALCAKDGVCRVFDSGLVQDICGLLPGIEELSFSPRGDVLCGVASVGIELVSAETGVTLRSLAGDFVSARYDARQATLWSISLTDDENRKLLEIRDANSFDVLATVLIDDPYGESHFGLYPHPTVAGMVVWIAAAQDGQQCLWAERTSDGILVRPLTAHSDTTPPAFHESGQEFLLITRDDRYRGILERISFPECRVLGSFAWPNTGDEADDPLGLADNQIGYDVNYLSDHYALLQSENGRAVVVELATMRVVDELVIAGHEPIPTRQVYPTLNRDGVTGDLEGVYPLGGGMCATVHNPTHAHQPDVAERVVHRWWWADAGLGANNQGTKG
jgi:hypothetical protein